MIKGANRRVVVMKDTGSEFFDEAYFLIKKDMLKNSKKTVMEATKIIKGLEHSKKKNIFLLPIFMFLSGCIAGFIAGLVL